MKCCARTKTFISLGKININFNMQKYRIKLLQRKLLYLLQQNQCFSATQRFVIVYLISLFNVGVNNGDVINVQNARLKNFRVFRPPVLGNLKLTLTTPQQARLSY